MKKTISLTAIISLFICIGLLSSCSQKETSPKPNIIYILADDLGYGELGCYGQEKIETPNLDQLAEKGIVFTQHYTAAPVCAPARCMLLTGLHSGHAYIRGNDEMRSKGNVWDYRAMAADPNLEGQRPLPENTITLGNLLKQAGYVTGTVGKWGLGGPGSEGEPNRQGFDFFYGYNCQRQAHTYYPLHLYKNTERDYLDNDTIPPHTKLKEGADPNDPASYADFNLKEYAPDLMFEELTSFVNTHQDTSFFLYWATPIPHVAIQAPQQWVDYYEEKFGKEAPYLGDKGYFPHPAPRAGYAAMITYLDDQIGSLIQQLKKLGIYDNTLILFSSDNGPSFAGGADPVWFDSARPFKGEKGYGKGFLHEGGIRVPFIASWPGQIPEGTRSDHISAFWDVMPTLCEIAGMEVPENIDGLSFKKAMLGQKEQLKHEHLYWEFPEYGGQRAVRMGKWKAIQKEMHKGNTTIELYDLETDIREEHNVASQHPEIMEQITAIFEKEHTPSFNDRWKFELLGD